MEYAIEVRNLTKEYENFKLENASFNVGKGTIMGFIGENGAGNSTTIKAILNLIKKDNGLITVLGKEINRNEKGIKNELGIVLNDGNFNEKLNVKAINKIMKNIYKRWDDDVFYKYIEKFNIDTSKKIEEFSKGMKMKLSIAIALSHKAKILILDEATSGLDPVARDEVLDILMEFIQNEENSILMSSHITSDLEKIADYITFIHNGKIIFNLNALKYTKASYFEILGEKYIKITTSSPWLLEKLGKYIFSSRAPQVLELAIGWRGALSESIKGVKFCIWFSVAWRTIEFIMSSERDLVNFLGDFSMDVAKAVIAGGVATAIGSLASFACVSFGFPVILVGGAILLTGIVCTVVLNEIDAQCHLSEKLKYAIRDGLKRQQELDKWKRENMTPFMYVLNTPPVI